jgi:hypothetical protein
MEFYERISGARMHAAFYRPNDLNLHAVSTFLLEDILEFNRNFLKTLNEMHNVLNYNKIWKQYKKHIYTPPNVSKNKILYKYKLYVGSKLTTQVIKKLFIEEIENIVKISQNKMKTL